MRFPLALALFTAVSLSVLPACRREEPPAPAPVLPATGWTAEDTATVTEGLGGALAGHAWVGQFREVNGRAPVIEVRTPEDRSGDQVPVADLETAFQHALGTSDRVLVAAQGQVADVALTSIVGLRKAGAAAFFTVDARVVDAKSGDRLWVGGLERPRQEPVPRPAPAPAR